MKIVESEVIRPELTDRYGSLTVNSGFGFSERMAAVVVHLVAVDDRPEGEWRVRSGSTGVFPLRFRG